MPDVKLSSFFALKLWMKFLSESSSCHLVPGVRIPQRKSQILPCGHHLHARTLDADFPGRPRHHPDTARQKGRFGFSVRANSQRGGWSCHKNGITVKVAELLDISTAPAISATSANRRSMRSTTLLKLTRLQECNFRDMSTPLHSTVMGHGKQEFRS